MSDTEIFERLFTAAREMDKASQRQIDREIAARYERGIYCPRCGCLTLTHKEQCRDQAR